VIDLNPSLVAWNKSNRERRKRLSKEFRRNLEREDVAIQAESLQQGHFDPKTSCFESFRSAKSYESDVIAAINQLSRLPIYVSQKERAGHEKLKVGQRQHQQGWIQFFITFVGKPQFRNAKPQEMWPELIAALDDLECRPKEIIDKKTPRRTKIDFEAEDSGGKPIAHHITYGRFLNMISQYRPKHS
jgi:hypothetical protein